jgi:class 3 adenylate cyclase
MIVTKHHARVRMVVPQRRAFAPRLIFKITLPYVALALILALATIYVVANLQSTSLASAFGRQLDETRVRVADGVVRTERAQLANVRTLARLTGLAQAMRAGDAREILSLVVPYAVSQNVERIVAVDMAGHVIAAVHTRGAEVRTDVVDAEAGQWPFVTAVLSGASDAQGDKYVALADDAGTPVLYTVTPIYAGDARVGALLAGTTASTLVERWRAETLADVTLYAADGKPLATSFGVDVPPDLDVGAGDHLPVDRAVPLGSRIYQEVVTRLVLRNSPTPQFVGVALSTAGQIDLLQRAGALLFEIFAGGIIVAFLLGIMLSRRITRPIGALVAASEGVAAGDLTQVLPVTTGDEIGALTTSFNAMIGGLRERQRMHDIFGRFVSPTVAQLVLSHPLDLSGESKLLTILFTDLRDFTTLAEQEDPATVIRALNSYFQIVVEAAERYGGIVNKFGGDSTLVLFGLADDHDDAQASAEAALHAALAIRAGLRDLNAQRADQQLSPLAAGIGINTGAVVAGLIGTERRMEYTVIGDAVNLSARIQTLNRKLGSDILISDDTYVALKRPVGLHVINYGWRRIKGKHHRVRVYAVTCWETDDAP